MNAHGTQQGASSPTPPSTANRRRALLWHHVAWLLLSLALAGCSSHSTSSEIEQVIRRYNALVVRGYQMQDMNPLQEVTTEEHARRLYHHMSALGEGGLRLESRLKNIAFKKIEQRGDADATVETEEIWDFTHYRMATGNKFAEEKDFIYRMGYILHHDNGRWVITEVTTIGGTSTNSVIPWPELDRKGQPIRRNADGKPAGHS